jgi:hypothetical protein
VRATDKIHHREDRDWISPQRHKEHEGKGSLEICSLCLWVFGGLCSFCELPFDGTRPLRSNLRVLCVFVVKLIFFSVNSCISVAKIRRVFGTGRQIHIQNSSFIAPEASIKGILIGNRGVVLFSI